VTAELAVDRTQFLKALKFVSKGMRKFAGDASLVFDNDQFCIEACEVSMTATATGIWPVPIYVRASWLRQMAKTPPAGDPVHLKIADGRIFADRYSSTCALVPRAAETIAEPSLINADRMIDEAAKILKPLRIKRAYLDSLIANAPHKKEIRWSPDERRMAAIIAKAWLLLAPLGIEMSDIRELVDNTVLNAWKK
jgi:hypothetical protein